MFTGLSKYEATRPDEFWSTTVPAHWQVMPGMAVLTENKARNTGLTESQVLSLSYGRVIMKPVEKQRGLVPDSYEGYQILEPGDIVIRPTDLQNDQRSIRVGRVRDRGIITSAYIGLRSKQPWTTDYAYLYLTAVDSTKLIYGMGSGLRQQLGWSDLKRMRCLVPPVDEQAAIVKYLVHASARIDKAIAAKRRLIALLQEQAQAEAEALIDYAAVDASEPLLGRALRRIEQGTSPSAAEGDLAEDQWAVLSLSAVNRGLFVPTALKPVDREFVVAPTLELHDGDLLMTRSNTRERVGDVAVVDGVRPKTFMSDLIYRLVLRDDLLIADFASILLRTRRVRMQIEGAARGSSDTMPKLTQGHIKGLRVSLPSLEAQKRVVATLQALSGPIWAAEARTAREVVLLQEFRTRLVADVVTGQVDVRDIAMSMPDINLASSASDVSGGVGDVTTDEVVEMSEV
jgi:type I restriction enzyme S subunit